MLWHLGNTTIRTPYRLRQALIALQSSPLNGNIIGPEKESEFAILLHNYEVAEVSRIGKGESDFSDFGRKWRSALTKLGFITQKFSDRIASGNIDPQIQILANEVKELTGRPYEITPNGNRLINSETVAAQQETFLRSIVSIQLPSPIETRFLCKPFSPLKFVLNILFEVKNRGESPHVSFEETALFIITNSPDNGLSQIVDSILDFRKRRLNHKGTVRRFDREEYKKAVLLNTPNLDTSKISTKAQTLDDYTDCTLRYLKATGLFIEFGRGITINDIKEELSELIRTTPESNYSNKDYLINFWNGAELPSDDIVNSKIIIDDLTKRIQAKGGVPKPLGPQEDVSLKRFELEEQLKQLRESEYYLAQKEKAPEILSWLTALLGNSARLPNGEIIRIPRGEAPAYFEWAIWRSFLAINTLTNLPWEARRFQVDQDFLPIGTAPGNGPDLIFEFEDSIIVVEVTLTSSSRQEAAEGEPVRRHVAKFAEQHFHTNKTVYGLFIALQIDSNTAHTFRTGDWYLKDDSKINLQIVPIRLEEFYKLFAFGIDKLDKMPSILQSFLLKCRAQANQDAPVWKKMISNIIDQTIKIN